LSACAGLLFSQAKQDVTIFNLPIWFRELYAEEERHGQSYAIKEIATSAFGTKQTSRSHRSMSALRGKADIPNSPRCPLLTHSGSRVAAMCRNAQQLQFDVVGCRSRAFGKAPGTAEIHKK